jgi:hypothetical protein
MSARAFFALSSLIFFCFSCSQFEAGDPAPTCSFPQVMASTASRDPGTQVMPNSTETTTSKQMSLLGEIASYAGISLPTTQGYNYRDIPDRTRDDTGYRGTSCKYAPRPATNCGNSQQTIVERIAGCATLNPATSTWQGSSQCNGGEGTWKLVTRLAPLKEVWQDQRTGLLWSSVVENTLNWCEASGNTQYAPITHENSYNGAPGTPMVGNGLIGAITGGSASTQEDIIITFTSATAFTVAGGIGRCSTGAISAGGLTTTAGSTVTWNLANQCQFTITQGIINFAVNDTFALKSVQDLSYGCFPGGLNQGVNPVSACAEAAGLNPLPGETWSPGLYMTAKGGMGAQSSPKIRWRLPTRADYMLAEINGARFVLPDAGLTGSLRPIPDASGTFDSEWTATVDSFDRKQAGQWDAVTGAFVIGGDFVNSNYAVRCVGR